jgi:hypothetical protein
MDTHLGFPLSKDDDLMIQTISIEEELFKTQNEQLFKVLIFSFMVIAVLIRSIQD